MRVDTYRSTALARLRPSITHWTVNGSVIIVIVDLDVAKEV